RERRPHLRDDLGTGQELLACRIEVQLEPATECVIRVDDGDAFDLRPRACDRKRGGDAVGGQDVGHAEQILGIRNLDLEQLVDATLGHDGQQLQLFHHGANGQLVVRRDYAREVVDLLDQLHALELFHRRLGTSRLVGGERLDLAPAEQAAGGVDL